VRNVLSHFNKTQTNNGDKFRNKLKQFQKAAYFHNHPENNTAMFNAWNAEIKELDNSKKPVVRLNSFSNNDELRLGNFSNYKIVFTNGVADIELKENAKRRPVSSMNTSGRLYFDKDISNNSTLPEGWERVMNNETGYPYYYKNGKSSWVHPSNDPMPKGWEMIMQKNGNPTFISPKGAQSYVDPRDATLSPGWKSYVNASSGKRYYKHKNIEEAQWEKP
jgi:hypothetical protein